MRLIDADALKRAFHEEWDEVLVWDESGETTADAFCDIVDAQPTIEPKHGRWIKLFETENDITARCSECGMVYTLGKGRDPNYCGTCGTRMDESEAEP